ncbi:MAG: hypothetical protein H6993_07615 [Pseudomonadales bacterium]|nr:hypothetical protein [Pseudomonadales bacterium]MCP5183814.1 hypothetical protein [Pseudomonadales bacterium]
MDGIFNPQVRQLAFAPPFARGESLQQALRGVGGLHTEYPVPARSDGADLSSRARQLSTAFPATGDMPAPFSVPRRLQAMSAEQFNQAVSYRSSTQHDETRLSLAVRTREGDVVTLQFRQADFALREQSADGELSASGFERSISLSVAGDLSAAEAAAVDGVLAQVADQLSALYSGDLNEAASKLANLDFGGDALASFALDFSRSTRQDVVQAYGGAVPGDSVLAQLARGDAGVATLLDSLAWAQRDLMAGVASLFDAPSGVTLANGIVGSLIAPVRRDDSLSA